MELKVAGEYGYVVAVASASWVRALLFSSPPRFNSTSPPFSVSRAPFISPGCCCLQAVCMWMGIKVGQARKKCVP